MSFPDRKGAGCLWNEAVAGGHAREGLAARCGPRAWREAWQEHCALGPAAVVAELDQKWSLRAKTALSRIVTTLMRILSRKK